MKKITCAMLVLTLFSMLSFSQTLNQSSNWPNTDWQLTGTYDAASLIANPTLDPNFSYNDDSAGSGSTDILSLLSPVIDLTAAKAAGETMLYIDLDYNYNFGSIFNLEYYDADSNGFITWQAIADNSGTTADWCSAIAGTTRSIALDITNFTTNQLENFQYNFYYDASSVFGWGFCISSSVISSEVPLEAPTNVDCANATEIICDQTINTTSTGSSGNQEGSGCSIGVNGIWFTFNGTGGDMTIESSASFDHEMAISSGDCGTLVNVGCDDGSLGTETFTFASDLDETYYLYIAHFADLDTTTGTIDVTLTCAEIPTCIPASFSLADGGNICPSDGGFIMEVDVTDLGTSTTVNILQDGVALYSGVDGTASPYLIGGLTSNTSYDITVEDAADDTCTSTQTFTTAECPPPAPANDDLADATPVSCGNIYAGNTTSATIDEEDAPDVATVEEDTNADTDSPNVWFSFVGTGDIITLSTCVNTDFDTELFVFTGSSGNLTCIDDGFDECGGSDVNFTAETTFTSVLGTQYWISVEGWNVGNVGAFELAITCTPPPTCIPATFSLADGGNICPSDGGFIIEVDVTALGTATTVNILQDGVPLYSGVDGTASPYLIGGLTSNTSYDITVEDAADNTCSSTQPFTIGECPPPPPANDEIAGAINLPVGDTLCETEVSGSNVSATDSVENDNEADCGSFDPAGDVWFKVTVPSTGDLTIETTEADVDAIFDTLMTVYSGTSGALVEIACSDDEGVGLFSLIELTGLTPGEVLLVRVWEFGDDSKGNFDICAWSPTTLGLDDNSFDGFKFYPNPVNDVLSLHSIKIIDAVEVYNVIGQRIININSNETIQNVEMAELQSGAYFVKISIANQIKVIKVIKE